MKKGDQRGIDGGISKGPADYPHGTRIIVEVDSVDHTLEQAVESGAQIIREKMEFDHFYLAYIVDPVGIYLGLLQNKELPHSVEE